MKNYTIRDISTTLSVSERTVQRWLESLIIKEKNKILIPQDILNILISRHKPDSITTNHDTTTKEFDRVEYFTEDEYNEFNKRLTEYPFLKERADILLKDIEYFKKSLNSKERQIEMILLAITNKKFIEEE